MSGRRGGDEKVIAVGKTALLLSFLRCLCVGENVFVFHRSKSRGAVPEVLFKGRDFRGVNTL